MRAWVSTAESLGIYTESLCLQQRALGSTAGSFGSTAESFTCDDLVVLTASILRIAFGDTGSVGVDFYA